MYGKIFKSMFEGTMRGKSDVLLVWTNFIVNADKDGYVDRTFRVVSEETGLSLERIEKAIIELESPDSESRSQELEGRRLERIDEHRKWGWRIVNYIKYSAMKNEEERREQNRLAQARFRSKKNQIVSNSKQDVSNVIKVSPLDVDIDINIAEAKNTHSFSSLYTPNEENQQNQPKEASKNSTNLEDKSHKSGSLSNGLTTSYSVEEKKHRQKTIERFMAFWKAYPRKSKQGITEQIWCDIFFSPNGDDKDQLYESIIKAVETQKTAWKDPQYIPTPDNWLKDRRWLDELPKEETFQERRERETKEMMEKFK